METADAELAVALERARELGAREAGLAVIAMHRSDGSTHASVVNAGVLKHPVTDDLVVGFVSRGAVKKLKHLRQQPRVTVVFRSQWEWVAVEGDAELLGPDDPLEGFDRERLLPFLCEVYAAAAGGTADEWASLGDSMRAERHTAVLIRPMRIYPKDERTAGPYPGTRN